ncbi:MAG TPA: HEAT repeat domain-containing protein [Polyangiaceae bacterium]|nr:HEAT repeat domain-containing protein [Polyangiaceae bacterium]
MSNAFASEDGNFKRGAFKPVAILIGLLLVGGAAVFFFLSVKQESASLTKEAVNKEIQDIQLLPKQEQIPRWRKWADTESEPRLRQEAFIHLAWAKDVQSLPSIAKGLTAVDHTVRGVAAMALVDFGSPTADPSKPMLLKAVTEATSADKPQICWALVALKEPAAFETIMAEYRLGHLAQVEKLDGYPAFDAEMLAGLVPIDKLASLAGDDSDSVRQLVATTLSRSADPKWTDTLIKLVNDRTVEVAREAAVGLGKIGNEKATQPLVDALSKADKASREKFLQALRDGMGANGLVLALRTVSHDKADTEKFQTKQIFDMLKELEDPRGGDALYQYVQTNSRAPAHWKVEAGMRMAEIGDVRAAEVLGWRMSQDPLKLYKDVDWPELRRDDNERVFAARMLADLAVIHPEKRDYLIKTAEEGVLDWVDPKNKPQPHANGMRFLALVGSRRAVPLLEKWADPKEKLPNEGAQPPFPEEWATAQSALRYLGWTKEPGAWRILEKQLHRRNKKLDVSWDSLMQGGLTILGMTLRALGVGAADGFAQWGDPKAYDQLAKYIEDPMENEQARMEGCFALSWVATDDQMKDVVRKIHNDTKTDAKANFLRQCYLETVIHKPVAEATAGLIDLLSPSNPDIELRHQAARAIGMGGITPAMVPQIFQKLSDVSLKADATLALILGADADTAARAVATYNDPNTPAEAIEELKDVYNKTFGYWSDHNYENGDIARWVQNAEAIAHVRVHDQLQDWPRLILGRNLVESIEIDNGPHSMTRVQLRSRLLNDAKGSSDVKRAEAIRILKFIKEKGALMALRYEPGPVAELAREAFFEVMNPKASAESVPESPKAQQQQQGGPPPGFGGGAPR